MKLLKLFAATLLFITPLLVVNAGEHGGKAAESKEHGGKAAEHKEHGGDAAEHKGHDDHEGHDHAEHGGEAAEHAGEAAEALESDIIEAETF